MSSIKDKIIKLRNNNVSYNNISKILGITKSTISYHCVKLGLNNPIQKNNIKITNEIIIDINNYYKTHTIEETSKKFNIGKSTVTKYLTDKKTKHKQINTCLNCGMDTINKKYCSQNCKIEYEYKEKIKLWLDGKLNGIRGKTSTSRFIKKYMIEKHGERCMECGWDVRNKYTNNVPIELEHINGNYLDNNENNLKLLCPNCHSLTSTYKGANKNSGRPRSKYYRGL